MSDTEPDREPRGPAYSPHWPTLSGGLFTTALGGLFCWLRDGISIVGGILLVFGAISVGKGLLGYQDD